MAINDSWTYTAGVGALFVVLGVHLETGEAHARAAFRTRIEAESYAEREASQQAAGPGWGLAVESPEGRVTWTSF